MWETKKRWAVKYMLFALRDRGWVEVGPHFGLKPLRFRTIEEAVEYAAANLKTSFMVKLA